MSVSDLIKGNKYNKHLNKIEKKKIKLENKINRLIYDFEKQTNTKELMFDSDKKPFETILIIDLDEILL